MKRVNPSTHQECRSLLQKAVRRGEISLAEKIARHLYIEEDPKWVTARTTVIVFEECWPLASELTLPLDFDDVLRALILTAQTEKNKEAAGLGSLAYALSEGEESVLDDLSQDEQNQVLTVRDAIQQPNQFWETMQSKCTQDNQTRLVKNAYRAYRRGGWPWDKAFMQAAAYLGVTNSIPEVKRAKIFLPCPMWVGIDKHTSKGKEILIKVARETKIPPRHLAWISFYCESALTNTLADINTCWWKRENEWRFHSIGLDHHKANEIWRGVRSSIARHLEEEVANLQKHLDTSKQDMVRTNQLSLFDFDLPN